MSENLPAVKRPSQMAPWTIADLSKFAEQVARSSFCPKDYMGKPGDVLVAMQYGIEVGLAPMAAVQNIAVINGRPSLWGDSMLALAQAHPRFVSIAEAVNEQTMTARCEIVRKGMAPVVRTFSKQDAETAGLWSKPGPWKQYPKRMLQMRARSFALRDAFADALKGIIAAEEAQDIIDITPSPTPQAQQENAPTGHMEGKSGLPGDEFEALMQEMGAAFERGEERAWWVGNKASRDLCSNDQIARLNEKAKEWAEAKKQTGARATDESLGALSSSGASSGSSPEPNPGTPPVSPPKPPGRMPAEAAALLDSLEKAREEGFLAEWMDESGTRIAGLSGPWRDYIHQVYRAGT